jgi:hypothetical protein
MNQGDLNQIVSLMRLPDDCRIESNGHWAINPDRVELITEKLHSVIAETVAHLLDAGSERDAVMENYPLNDAIRKELKGWTT